MWTRKEIVVAKSFKISGGYVFYLEKSSISSCFLGSNVFFFFWSLS